MADKRSYDEIERTAKTLHQVWYIGCQEHDTPHRVWLEAWCELSPAEQHGWIELAKAVPGVIHHEAATSGGFPTSGQADRIRDDLRKSYTPDLWEETHSFIGSMTRPYGDMVVVYQAKAKLPGAKVDVRPIRAFLIHPSGHMEELHKAQVPDGPYVTKASA
jgi:hypothetical protein